MNGTAILAELLTASEGKTLEFDRGLSSLKPILKSLVALQTPLAGHWSSVAADDGAIVVLREFGLLEEWGTGYRRVTEDCRAGGYPAPEWEERGPALRVVFRPHPEVAAAADETVGVPGLETANETVNEIASET